MPLILQGDSDLVIDDGSAKLTEDRDYALRTMFTRADCEGRLVKRLPRLSEEPYFEVPDDIKTEYLSFGEIYDY